VTSVLFIGGTGNISTYVVELALERGYDVTLLNRGRREWVFSRPVSTIVADRHDRTRLSDIALANYDIVADFIGFTPGEAQDDIAAFVGHVGQFVYISSVAAYQKPPAHYVQTESAPLHNPFWRYAQDKISSELIFNRAYREQRFPVTVVRPWHTYGCTRVPTATMGAGYTAVDRVRRGLPILCHGDGQSLWGLTWSGDIATGIVGLFGKQQAIGEAFHITTEEILTWDQIYRTMAAAAGASEPEMVHLASDTIHAIYPELGTPLLGDLSHSAVYDNSKIRRLVPEYRARTTWAEGVARSIAWMDANSARRTVDAQLNTKIDHLIRVAQSAGR
jgi:nucleoside-diphosphate-sugar epimerase